MFDYQAGEKYKLTLIMVAAAGFMAGMFISFILMPSSEPPHARPRPAYMDDPDASGRARMEGGQGGQPAQMPAPQDAQAAAAQTPETADPVASLNLVQQWLPLAWDLSAGSAKGSQERAILYMTPECAEAYRKNIWTTELSQQIDTCGIRSTFRTDKVSAGGNQSDGSIIVTVDGEQVLSVPGKGSRARKVKLEYLVRSTADGLRIAGISEAGRKGG